MVARKKLTVLKAQLEVGLAGAVGDFAISRDYDRFADGSKARGIRFRGASRRVHVAGHPGRLLAPDNRMARLDSSFVGITITARSFLSAFKVP